MVQALVDAGSDVDAIDEDFSQQVSGDADAHANSFHARRSIPQQSADGFSDDFSQSSNRKPR